MTKLLAQHGYGKGSKIIDSINAGSLQGAIFSPDSENIERIVDYCNTEALLTKSNSFLDPVFYYSTFDRSVLKKLTEVDKYPTDVQRRDWRKKSKNVIEYIDYHAEKTNLISNTLITPGFYVNGIDWKFDYSLDIYRYCLDKYDFNNYAMSLLIDFSLFNNLDNVKELIYELTEEINNKQYIYLTICYERGNNSNYDVIFSSPDVDGLGNILYFIYCLRKEGYKFIIGYTFMDSLLFSALGCEYVANGWFNSLRKFQNDRFEDFPSFGRRKKRYTSLPLLSNIMYEDIDTMLGTGKILEDNIKSGTLFDNKYSLKDEALISLVELEHQFWQSISLGLDDLNEFDNDNDKLTYFINEITRAIDMYQPILRELGRSKADTTFQNRIRVAYSHLPKWLAAINIFKAQALIY